MKQLILISFSVLAAVLGTVVITYANHDSEDLAKDATSQDNATAQKARETLRDMGPQGLAILQARYANEIRDHRSGAFTGEQWPRISAALDRVGGQYDNYASGLYWYTDLDQAKAAARASGKPILSLRLLGRLDENLSCANSRFFRTTLYPSAQINQLLKERFILHWESVRPAPRVTIDFGDGRKLERTITGNSIHYILDEHGNIIDALPGLYAAQTFSAELRQAADAFRPDKTAGYYAHLSATQTRLLRAWQKDLATIDRDHVNSLANKTLTREELESAMDDRKWEDLAMLHVNEVEFDGNVRGVIATKFPGADVAATLAMSKSLVEKPMLDSFKDVTQPIPADIAAPLAMSKMAVERPMVNSFKDISQPVAPVAMRAAAVERPFETPYPKLTNNVAIDTVRNNYLMRTKILAMLLNRDAQPWTLAQFNDWVYAKVFLTPRQDPWLGLAPPDVYAALDNNGEIR